MKTPDHYTSTKTPIERLPDVYKEGFFVGNIIKYASRAGLKKGFIQDLDKCIDYALMLVEWRLVNGEGNTFGHRLQAIVEAMNAERVAAIGNKADQPEPTYNQPQVADHPAPKGIVPPLPEGAVIPDNGYQLGLEDVLNEETDWLLIGGHKWQQVRISHGDTLGERLYPYAYRIYK